MLPNSVICLMGPTASGKTKLACDLITRLPCEIISVDSALVYCEMNIGTAKPDAQTLATAPHHLIDILDPTESYSAAQFCQDANHLCDEIIQRGKIPLLVGGTMMYFHALQQGLSVLPEANPDIREQIIQRANQLGWDELHHQLAQIDPLSAARIHPHDTQRIQRALEVYAVTGRSLTDNLRNPEPAKFNWINWLILPTDRAWLHARINQRFAQMLAEGFIQEVEQLLANWPSLTPEMPSLRCVGYRQIYEYLQGAYDYDTLLAKGCAATRQLAKRQLTWLRQWPQSHCFEAENLDTKTVIQQLLS